MTPAGPPLRDLPSPNQGPRAPGVPVDVLLLHYTGMTSAQAALDRLRDPAAEVSSHYVVDEDGTTWRLVPEDRRARHAGISHWRGHVGLNDRSVGIEIVNPGHEHGYRPFPPAQVAAVRALCHAVLARHPIPPRNVVAHSDVAPDRKEDPGELFPWVELAAAGIGLFPDVPDAGPTPCPPEAAAALMRDLATVGYRADLPADVLLRAAQRHWRPERVSGVADLGTAGRIAALVEMLK